MAKDILHCVQCSKEYRESENTEESCYFHCGRLAESGTLAWFTCCPERKMNLDCGYASAVPGCAKERHRGNHHTDYPYAAYINFMEQQAANAREVWMEMDVPDHVTPGRYEWAEVGLLESGHLYILIGNEERCMELVEFTTEQLRLIQQEQPLMAIERPNPDGWNAKAIIHSRDKACKAVQVSIKPAFSSTPVVKRVAVYCHGNVPMLGKQDDIIIPSLLCKPTKAYSIPKDTYEGSQLELDLDYRDLSKGRKNDYHTETENGCPLSLQQEGHTAAFSRHCRSDDEKCENVFTATIKITNTAEEKLHIASEVIGEYLDHEGVWVRCDEVLVTKDFFPGMYKWCLGSQNFSLDPGFTDNLTAQLSIRFTSDFLQQCKHGRAHPSLPQPLHLRVTFVTEERHSASLRFEQGNPPDIPTQEQREEEWSRELVFYTFADDGDKLKRVDAAIYYDTPSGHLCYRCATGSVATAPTKLWPYLHYAAYQAKKMGQCEYELVQLKAAAEGRCAQVIALVDLQATFTYALRVITKTPTSTATGYWLVPYIDPGDASFTVEPKEVSSSGEIYVSWLVPRASEEDHIGIYHFNGRRAVMEKTNGEGARNSHLHLEAPNTPGLYEVRYYSVPLADQCSGHHSKYWVAGTILVTTFGAHR